MNRWMKLSGLSLMFVFGVSLALAQEGKKEEPKKEEAKPAAAAVLCPTCSKPANLAVSTETDDGPVFFCCPMCIEGYKKEAAKYAAAVADQRKALAGRAKVQVRCPMDGKPIEEKVTSEKGGQKVHFCCDKCMAKYDLDAAKYKGAVANSYTYQTLCPVMGKAIDPDDSVKLPTGETIYFCCEKCGPKFMADAAKYAPALEAQGYKIDVSKIKPAEKKPEGEKKAG